MKVLQQPTVDQTGGVHIFDGSPATVEPTAYQAGAGQITSIGDLNTTSLISSRFYCCRTSMGYLITTTLITQMEVLEQ
jgi:hypothetical protein